MKENGNCDSKQGKNLKKRPAARTGRKKGGIYRKKHGSTGAIL